jgi:uncharacterized LabA/DUF88 family protein/cold shock CspA family protein
MKIGVYVDTSNLYFNGGREMRYDVLRRFAARSGGVAVRLNAYVAYDPSKANEDEIYRQKQNLFFSKLRSYGYKVIVKETKRYYTAGGKVHTKANADVDLAVDCLLQSEGLDRIVIVSGDGDFARLVRALQQKGSRVEVVGFHNVSSELIKEADMYLSGFLIPNLLPTQGGWGNPGSFVCGEVDYYDPNKGFGFFRYLTEIDGDPHEVDIRREDSPYRKAYFHISSIDSDSEELIKQGRGVYRFKLIEGENPEHFSATNIELIRPENFQRKSRYTPREDSESNWDETVETIQELCRQGKLTFPMTITNFGHALKYHDIPYDGRLSDMLREYPDIFHIREHPDSSAYDTVDMVCDG